MNFDFKGIIDYIVIIMPTIVSVAGVIVGFLKIVRAGHNSTKKVENEINLLKEEMNIKVDALKEEFNLNREALETKNVELKDSLINVLSDNAELKKQNEELMKLITQETRS